MKHHPWTVILWVALWVAIIGLYACVFDLKSQFAAERRRADRDLVTHEQMRAWTAKLARDNDAVMEVPEF